MGPLLDHRLSRRAALAGTLAAASSLVPLPARTATPAALDLPPAFQRGGMTLAEALARRRSQRRFATQALPLPALAQLLWAAQGQSAPGRRTAPSAGALYPIEVHVVAGRVDGLAPGAYRYRSEVHALQRGSEAATPAALQGAALGQAAVGVAPTVLVLAAVEARSAARYATRAVRYVAVEAGAAAQNLALQAVALGLGSVVVGAFDDAAVARVLQLPEGEQPLLLLPVGAGD
jgi:SagB-type dehydrogenase family enzyme